MSNSQLKSMLSNFINDKMDEAQHDLSNYLSTKIKKLVAVKEEDSSHMSFDGTDETTLDALLSIQ